MTDTVVESPPVHLSKIDRLFADRPEVQASIIKARTERKLSFQQIAQVLSTDPDVSISDGAVKGWLNRNGIS